MKLNNVKVYADRRLKIARFLASAFHQRLWKAIYLDWTKRWLVLFHLIDRRQAFQKIYTYGTVNSKFVEM